MKKIKNIIPYLTLLSLFLIVSCRKDFLDAKPNAALVVPSTLEDFQAILDNVKYMNGSTPGTFGITGANGGPNPMLLEVATDNYYIPDVFFNTFQQYYKNVYLWSKEDAYGGIASVADWSFPYRAVFYSNVALDGLKEVPQSPTNQVDWNRIKGSALFYRAHCFFQLAQAFAPAYDKEKASQQLGIPLRLVSDISEQTVRANIETTYSQIINDLKEAANLLPNEPLYKTRPSVPAVYGLLARVYLSMSDYENARLYAEKCLQVYSKPLLNFNTLSSSATYPFPKFNDEVIFSSLINNMPGTLLYGTNNARIDSNLYQSFDTNDLRKDLYFKLREPKAYSYRGSYDGNGYPFFGIATDEIYLILSESLARLHDIPTGIKYLNQLLSSRYKTVNGISSFTPYNIGDEEGALKLILAERRKELLMRGLRLTDLRRLNMDARFAKTLYRKINGQTYELSPTDLRYTWPIPNDVIALTGIQQNPR